MTLPDTYGNIRSVKSFIDNLVPWDKLRGAFGRGSIRPTDIDGMVERKNSFLFFEGKKEGTDLPLGQKIALENLAKTPRVTVICFSWYPVLYPANESLVDFYSIENPSAILGTGWDQLFTYCQRWYERVN